MPSSHPAYKQRDLTLHFPYSDTADVTEHDYRQSFFEGMGIVVKASKQQPLRRTCSMVDISLKSIRSWFASIGDHSTPPPVVEHPQSEQPYHYRKRSLRRAVSFRNGDIGDPSPDEQNVDIAQRRAGTLGTAIRAIESASYVPPSPFSINTLDRSSGSYQLAFNDIDSVSSRSAYSPTSSPVSPVHRVLLFTEYKEDKVEQIPKDARREYAFEQPLAASFDSDKPPASPLRTLRPRTVSFSRPTPQVYPHLICQTTAQQESLHQVVHRSPVRTNVPLEATSGHCPAPLSPPPLPSRNPKRTPSDSGHGPLIHATLDQSFRRGGQDKFTPGPNAVVLKSSQQPRPLRVTETRSGSIL